MLVRYMYSIMSLNDKMVGKLLKLVYYFFLLWKNYLLDYHSIVLFFFKIGDWGFPFWIFVEFVELDEDFFSTCT